MDTVTYQEVTKYLEMTELILWQGKVGRLEFWSWF
jgi:hypothetical protein